MKTRPIRPNEILRMYQRVLPLLVRNPEKRSMPDAISEQIAEFIRCDFAHCDVETPTEVTFRSIRPSYGEKNAAWTGKRIAKSAMLRSVRQSRDDWKESVEQHYEQTLQERKLQFPNERGYDYHRVASNDFPRIVLGFFRIKSSRGQNSFSAREKAQIERLAPHLFLLLRIAALDASRSNAFQLLDSVAGIASQIAKTHKLSDAEVALIPDVLFGYSNRELAERHFVSVETIKSHLKHIFHKTETRGRSQFVSKFFQPTIEE